MQVAHVQRTAYDATTQARVSSGDIPGYGVATGNSYRDISGALTLTTNHWMQEVFLL
jgi:hypothetical protein